MNNEQFDSLEDMEDVARDEYWAERCNAYIQDGLTQWDARTLADRDTYNVFGPAPQRPLPEPTPANEDLGWDDIPY